MSLKLLCTYKSLIISFVKLMKPIKLVKLIKLKIPKQLKKHGLKSMAF
jgi:hypothetical protein